MAPIRQKNDLIAGSLASSMYLSAYKGYSEVRDRFNVFLFIYEENF
jgi:hypothetical protein